MDRLQGLVPAIEVDVDRLMMHHVFLHLISNAVKHNRSGGLVTMSLCH